MRAAVAIVLWLATSASAQTTDPSYPIVSFLDWTQNVVASFRDPAPGTYNLEAGELGILTRAVDRYPMILLAPPDPAATTGVNLGSGGSGIGYGLVKQRYDELRDHAERSAAMELLILEGGVHTDHVDPVTVPRTDWALALAGDYAADWLNCHVAGIAQAYTSAVGPREHLSRAFASEHVASDSTASQCIRVPDRAILNQPPADFFAAFVEGEPVCDCYVGAEPACAVKPTFTP